MNALTNPELAVYPGPEEPGVSERDEGWDGALECTRRGGLRRARAVELGRDRKPDADHLQPARQRGEGVLRLLLARIAEELVVVAELIARRDQHAGGYRQELHELVLDALPE